MIHFTSRDLTNVMRLFIKFRISLKYFYIYGINITIIL